VTAVEGGTRDGGARAIRTDAEDVVDTIVIGAGPAGAAAAIRLATAGHRVTVVERRSLPRTKTCGDTLTPRAVHELITMGVAPAALAAFHRIDNVGLTGRGNQVEIGWPSHPVFPAYGLVARRDRLDELVAARAVAAGATLLDGHEAVAPIVDRGFVRGVVVRRPDGTTAEMCARYLVVADGANSRFGRALGTSRERTWPYATAIRNYFASPLHATPTVELTLDLTDLNGTPITGYGWVFPLADGTINVGTGVVSTARNFKAINTTHLLERFAIDIAERWKIDPTAPLGAPASGRVPMGGSVGPAAGPTWLVIGDAAGSANPFVGAGIEYAYETGRIAGDVLVEALRENSAPVLQQYPARLDEAYGTYFKIGRLFDRFAGRPALMNRLAGTVTRHRSLAAHAVRVATNELRPSLAGPPELAYRVAGAISRIAPRA
jgi:geranylgeranyl reductase family protein